MTKKASHLKLMAIIAVLGITLIPNLRTSTAAGPPPAAGADIGNEQRLISKYFEDFVAYDKQVADLGKKGRTINVDFDPLQQKANDLKGRLSAVQNATREIIKKLKAANEWDNLDTTLEAKFDSKQRSVFRQASFKRFLEDSSNNLSGRGNEISTPLENLRRKLTSKNSSGFEFQIVQASYRTASPTPFGSPDSFGCAVGRWGLIALKILGGHPTDLTYRAVFEQCWPEGAESPW
jgi:hypothetical protein